jgi:hypothetical protein
LLGMYPPISSVDLPIMPQLSIAPVPNASLYDYYVYSEDSPGNPAISNTNSISISPQLAPNTTYNWFVTAKNTCSSANSDTLSFTTIGEIDLQMDTMIVQSSTVSGATIPVTFTLSNVGTGSTGSTPFDVRIWLSTDIDLRIGDDQLLSIFNNLTYLQPGQSYTQTVFVDIPIVTGTWYIFVIADNDDAGCSFYAECFAGNVGHHNSWIDEPNETNNHYWKTITVLPAPAPDLVPSLVGGANNGAANQDYTASVTITNQGNFILYDQSFKVKIYLSQDDEFSISDELVYTGTFNNEIEVGNSIILQTQFAIPYDLSGVY